MRRLDAARAAMIQALLAGLALAFANREQSSQQALQQWLAAAGWWAPVAFIAIYNLAGATLGAVLAFLVARHLSAR